MSAECVTCGKQYSRKDNLRNLHYSGNPSHAPDSWTTCPECGKKFDDIGMHFANNNHIPELNKKQMDILTGIVMSDGHVRSNTNGKKARIVLATINNEYLESLSKDFGLLTTDIRLKSTADELAKRSRRSGFNENAKVENYNDVYEIEFRTHPQLRKFLDWYDEQKMFPEDLELNPNILKHWFVGDGSKIQGSVGRPHISIKLSNEKDNKEKIERYFNDIDIPISNWCQEAIVFGTDESAQLWAYMGEPPKGHEYKWP